MTRRTPRAVHEAIAAAQQKGTEMALPKKSKPGSKKVNPGKPVVPSGPLAKLDRSTGKVLVAPEGGLRKLAKPGKPKTTAPAAVKSRPAGARPKAVAQAPAPKRPRGSKVDVLPDGATDWEAPGAIVRNGKPVFKNLPLLDTDQRDRVVREYATLAVVNQDDVKKAIGYLADRELFQVDVVRLDDADFDALMEVAYAVAGAATAGMSKSAILKFARTTAQADLDGVAATAAA